MFDPNLVARYTQAFSKCYPDTPLAVKGTYKHGQWVGYRVFLRGSEDHGGVVIDDVRMAQAIRDFEN